METFTIQLTNDEFSASTQKELDNMEAARAQALKGALEVGCEQMLGGKLFFGAEVVVRCGGSTERFLVSIGTTALRA